MSLPKRVALIVASGLTLVLLLSATSLCLDIQKRLHAFDIEDQIHDTFSPVVLALNDYQDDHHAAAADLSQLVPKYLPAIPTSPLVDSVEYAVLDNGKTWRLTLPSHALPQARLYCSRSDDQFTPEEEQRVVLRYHGMWTVLKAP